MLHVNLLRLVAGEGCVKAREHAFLLKRCEFVLVEEIRGATLFAEEQPVAALRTVRPALLQERAKRRDARAGTNHDDVPSPVLRQTEVPRFLDVDGDVFLMQLRVVGEKTGA